MRVHLALGATDMRKGFDELAAQVQTLLKADPFTEARRSQMARPKPTPPPSASQPSQRPPPRIPSRRGYASRASRADQVSAGSFGSINGRLGGFLGGARPPRSSHDWSRRGVLVRRVQPLVRLSRAARRGSAARWAARSMAR
nr:IS66 family insertion sequence element accessory protein TnpB [Roseomonas fluvialis]